VGSKGQSAGEKFVQDDREGINVRARVNVRNIGVGLFGTHVRGRADEISGARDLGGKRISSADGFGNAEIDDAGNGFAIEFDDQDIGGLEVAMNARFLVGVLHAFADFAEEFDAFANGKALLVAIQSDGDARGFSMTK